MILLFIAQRRETTCLPLSIVGCSGSGVGETLLPGTSMETSAAGGRLPVLLDQAPLRKIPVVIPAHPTSPMSGSQDPQTEDSSLFWVLSPTLLPEHLHFASLHLLVPTPKKSQLYSYYCHELWNSMWAPA